MNQPWQKDRLVSDFELDCLLADALDADQRERVMAICRRDVQTAQRLAEMRAERDAFRRTHPSLQSLASRRAPRRRHRPWIAAAASAAVVALCLLLLPKAPSDPDTVRIKGDLRFSAYMKHQDRVVLVQPGDDIFAGAQLRFVVHTATPGFLAVIALDGGRQAHVYYPAEPYMEPIEPGNTGRELALPLSTELDDVLGEERIVALMCSAPLDLQPILRALEQTGTTPSQPECTTKTLIVRKKAWMSP